jgi:hypothetical protein
MPCLPGQKFDFKKKWKRDETYRVKSTGLNQALPKRRRDHG